ncbi:MAG TPA: hypothetical protein VGI45_12480 [Terracidiphilus sp.]|jgi:hypothetical protein
MHRKTAILLLSMAAASCSAEAQRTETNPSRIQTIYIVPSSHWDLGFKLPPEEQLDDIKPHLDAVIRTAKQDPEFRWVIESTWQVQAWLDRTKDPAAIQDLVDLVHNGQIELSAAWGSEHTEFMGTEQLNRLVYGMRDIEKRLGVKTDLAMMDDVPGFTLRLPQVLSRSGIRYFVTGSNLFLGGGTTLHPGKMPFHWQSPDGSTVLTWQTGSKNGGYVEAMADYYLDPDAHYYSEPAEHKFYPREWRGLSKLEIMQRGVNKLLTEYEKAGYRYDAVMVLYVHDFIPPSYEEDGLLPAVRAWNAAGKQPRLVVATPQEFFTHLAKEYGDPFPTYAGDFSGLWSEVKTNSPGITADARWVQDYMPQAESLWSLLAARGAQFPASTIDDAANKMLKYDEHSGAGQPGWPKVMTLDQVNKQNEEYANYTKTAKAEIRELMMRGIEQQFASDPDPKKLPKCVVFNPLSWERSSVVRVRPPSPDLTQVRDLASGKVVRSQVNLDGSLSFMAEGVPSFGFRTYVFESSSSPPAKETEVGGDTLENEFYKVRLRTSDGSVDSIWDKQLHRELVNTQSPRRVGQLIRWNYANYLPDRDWKPKVRHVRGPLTDELLVFRAGTWWPETRISLTSGERQLTMDEVFDRSRMPQVQIAANAEFYSFDFPFQFANPATIMVDDGIGFHDSPKDLLPGARTDGVTPIHTLSLLGSDDAPKNSISILQRDGFFDVPLRYPGSNGAPGQFLNEIRLTALRKVDQGDMKDAGVVTLPTVEPGYGPRYTSSFAVTSSIGFDPAVASKDGWNFVVPLITALLPPDHKPHESAGSFFSVSAPNVMILAFKPSDDGNRDHYMLRLQEIAGREETFALQSSLKIAALDETSMTEDRILHPGLDQKQLRIGAHQTLTLQLTIDRQPNN